MLRYVRSLDQEAQLLEALARESDGDPRELATEGPQLKLLTY